jgi:hypothetical protein
MIARIWHGYTQPEHADAYEAMLKAGTSAGYQQSQRLQGQLPARENDWQRDRVHHYHALGIY